jgi:hypothetical protein
MTSRGPKNASSAHSDGAHTSIHWRRTDVPMNVTDANRCVGRPIIGGPIALSSWFKLGSLERPMIATKTPRGVPQSHSPLTRDAA